MTAVEIIAKAEAGGISMKVQGGKMVLSGKGPTIASNLIEAARARKEDNIAVLSDRQTDKPETVPGDLSVRHQGGAIPVQRYALAPDRDILLVPIRPGLPQNYGHLLTSHILRQGRPVLDWVMVQANRYWETFHPRWSHQDCDHAAALDVLIWQLGSPLGSSSRWHSSEAVLEVLEGVENVSALEA